MIHTEYDSDTDRQSSDFDYPLGGAAWSDESSSGSFAFTTGHSKNSPNSSPPLQRRSVTQLRQPKKKKPMPDSFSPLNPAPKPPTPPKPEKSLNSIFEFSDDESFDSVPQRPKPNRSAPNSVSPLNSFHSDSEDEDTILAEGDVTVNVNRRREQVTAYNDLGEGFSKGAVLDENLHQRIEIVFSALKGMIVADKKKNVQIEFVHGINVDNAIVWIREADGSGAISKKLSKLIDENPESELAMRANELVALAKIVWPKASTAPSPAIAPRCKAPNNASAVRPSAITQTITNDYSTCAKTAMQICTPYLNPAEQDKALKRITAAESIISEMQKTIDRELKTHGDNLALAAPNSQDQATAQAAIDELKQYETMNRLGLYVAVAFAGSIDLRDMDKAFYSANQIAAEIQGALQTHLDSIQEEMVDKEYLSLVPNKIQDMLWDTPKHLKDETTAKWAAALVYSILPEELARKGAAGYWAKEKSVAYKDGVEDDLVRFVIRAEQDPTSTAEIATPAVDAMFATVKKHHGGFVPTLQGLKDGTQPILAGAGFSPDADIDSKMTALRARHPEHQFI